MAKKIVKASSFLLLSPLVAAIILLGIAYYWASSDEAKIPEQVSLWLQSEANLMLGGETTFRIDYWQHFPFLAIDIQEVQLTSLDSCALPLFEAQHVNLLFHPIKLFHKELQLERIYIQEGKIFIQKNEDGSTNLPSLLGGENNNDIYIHPLDIRLEHVEFEYNNVEKQKHHQMLFHNGAVALASYDEGFDINIQGNCFFYELLFKSQKGPYLKDAEAALDLSLRFDQCSRTLDFLPSTLEVNKATVNISGALELKDTNWLQLTIATPSISLEQGLPILSFHLQEQLSRFRSDQPFQVEASLAGQIGVEPIPLSVQFETQEAKLSADNIEVTQANLKGFFDNQCLQHPEVKESAKCLDLKLSKGLLFNRFPIVANIFNNGIPNTGIIADGQIEIPLPTLNAYLPSDKAFFESGHCSFPFELKGDPALLFDQSVDALGVALQAEALVSGGQLQYLPNELKCENIQAKLKIEGRDMIISNLLFMIKQDSFQFSGRVVDFLPMVLQKSHHLYTDLTLESNALNLDSLLSMQENQILSSQSLQLIEDISQQGNLNLHVNVDTLQINKMYVQDVNLDCEIFNQCTADGFKATSCLQINNFTGVVYDSIQLHASILATELSNPYIQMHLGISAPLEQLNPLMPQDKLLLHSGDLLIKVDYEGHLADYTSMDAAILNGQIQGTSTLDEAVFEYLPNGFEFEKIKASLRFDEQYLYVDELIGSLNDNHLEIEGFITGFMPFLMEHQEVMKTDLLIHTPRLDFSTLQLQPQSNTTAISSLKPSAIGSAIDRTIQKIEGNLDVCADELLFRNLRMTQVVFQAAFFQHCNDVAEAQSCIIIDSLSALLWGSAPFSAKVQVTGLEHHPIFIADVQADLPLLELNRMFPPSQFSFLGGHLQTTFHYEGCPDEQFDINTNLLNAFFQGEVRLISGGLDFKPRGFEFRQLNGSFAFDNKGLYLHHITTSLNGNQIVADGSMPNFMPFLLNPGQRLQAELNLKSPHFSFDKFKAPQKYVSRIKGKAIAPTQFTVMVDSALEQIIAKLKIQIDTISYRQFRGTSISGILTMRPDYLRFDEVNIDIADGYLALNGQVSGLENYQPEIDIRAKFKQADIQKVFYAFDNFGQDQLLTHNIAGTLNADINFQTKGNANYDLLTETQRGSIRLEVIDGELIDFPALQAMNGVIFKKRNMDHVQFANLKNNFTLEGQNLKIEHFYVVSNVLDFGLQGVYSLGNTEDTQLLFEVPVSNIFRRDLKIMPDNQTKGRWKILPILLEATEEKDGLKLNHRLFRGKWKQR